MGRGGGLCAEGLPGGGGCEGTWEDGEGAWCGSTGVTGRLGECDIGGLIQLGGVEELERPLVLSRGGGSYSAKAPAAWSIPTAGGVTVRTGTTLSLALQRQSCDRPLQYDRGRGVRPTGAHIAAYINTTVCMYVHTVHMYQGLSSILFSSVVACSFQAYVYM